LHCASREGSGHQNYPASQPHVTSIKAKLPEHINDLIMNKKFCDLFIYFNRPRDNQFSTLLYTDFFKYWSSYRKENDIQRGISNPSSNANNEYAITDASPFIVYNNAIYANRIVIKMQTNVGDFNLGNLRIANDKVINDPLYDYSYASVPKTWKVQKLNDSNVWQNIIEFDGNSERSDSSEIIPKDGHLELFYGVNIPEEYNETFNLIDYTTESLLPSLDNLIGDAYIINYSSSSAGNLKVWNGTIWETNTLEYGWSVYEDTFAKSNGVVSRSFNPLSYASGSAQVYREFEKMKGGQDGRKYKRNNREIERTETLPNF
jgi:hypothetical protein